MVEKKSMGKLILWNTDADGSGWWVSQASQEKKINWPSYFLLCVILSFFVFFFIYFCIDCDALGGVLDSEIIYDFRLMTSRNTIKYALVTSFHHIIEIIQYNNFVVTADEDIK